MKGNVISVSQTHQALKKAQKENEDLQVQVQELKKKRCQAEQPQKQTAQVQFLDLLFYLIY